MANISFNPGLTTSPQNSFLLDTQGLIQGLTMDDWNSRAWLRAGQVGSAVTQPVWGGMAVTVTTNGLGQGSTGNNGWKNVLTVPGSGGSIQGFTVFDQAINLIQVPGNQVPVANANQDIGYYTFGSNARIPVPIPQADVTDFENVDINIALYWDYSAFQVTTVSGGTTIALPSTVKLDSVHTNSKTVNYNSGTGACTWNVGQYCALIII